MSPTLTITKGESLLNLAMISSACFPSPDEIVIALYTPRAHSSRTKSERIRNEADTLMANCASKTQRSQQEASNRLGTRIEDCNSWRADLQTELDNNIR